MAVGDDSLIFRTEVDWLYVVEGFIKTFPPNQSCTLSSSTPLLPPSIPFLLGPFVCPHRLRSTFEPNYKAHRRKCGVCPSLAHSPACDHLQTHPLSCRFLCGRMSHCLHRRVHCWTMGCFYWLPIINSKHVLCALPGACSHLEHVTAGFEKPPYWFP